VYIVAAHARNMDTKNEVIGLNGPNSVIALAPVEEGHKQEPVNALAWDVLLIQKVNHVHVIITPVQLLNGVNGVNSTIAQKLVEADYKLDHDPAPVLLVDTEKNSRRNSVTTINVQKMLLYGVNGVSSSIAQDHVVVEHKAEFVIVLVPNVLRTQRFKHKYAIPINAQENVLINVLTVSYMPLRLIVRNVGIIWVYIVAKHAWNNQKILTTRNQRMEVGVNGHHMVPVAHRVMEVYKRELELAPVQAQ